MARSTSPSKRSSVRPVIRVLATMYRRQRVKFYCLPVLSSPHLPAQPPGRHRGGNSSSRQRSDGFVSRRRRRPALKGPSTRTAPGCSFGTPRRYPPVPVRYRQRRCPLLPSLRRATQSRHASPVQNYAYAVVQRPHSWWRWFNVEWRRPGRRMQAPVRTRWNAAERCGGGGCVFHRVTAIVVGGRRRQAP